MLSKIGRKLNTWERQWRYSFGDDITDPWERRKSKFHYHVFDHAFLRIPWTNFYPVSEGVWRSNQPTHARFERYAEMGIKAVINLRGEDPRAHYLFEEESCAQLGLNLYNCRLWARRAAERENIVAVIDLMREIERPFMFHCKSGADRAGFCAALYQMVFDGVPVQQARKQLSFKFIHIKWSKTGVLDYTLDVFEARQIKSLKDTASQSAINFETWIRTEYDHEVIQRGFDSKTPPAQIA